MTALAPSPAALAARRFFRLAPAVLRLLQEVRSSGMDEAARRRLAAQDRLLVAAVERSVPEELRAELAGLVAPPADEASEGEVRLALAQLTGWVQGTLSSLGPPSAAPVLVPK